MFTMDAFLLLLFIKIIYGVLMSVPIYIHTFNIEIVRWEHCVKCNGCRKGCGSSHTRAQRQSGR